MEHCCSEIVITIVVYVNNNKQLDNFDNLLDDYVMPSDPSKCVTYLNNVKGDLWPAPFPK